MGIRIHTEETKKKIRDTFKFRGVGFPKGYKSPWNNIIKGTRIRVLLSCEYCKKEYEKILAQSKRSRFCSNVCRSAFQGKRNIGENNGSWKGGISDINFKIRTGSKYKRFRKEVFSRDGKICCQCGSNEKLEIDHIKAFALYPELRYEPTNGRVLCHACHVKTPNYGRAIK